MLSYFLATVCQKVLFRVSSLDRNIIHYCIEKILKYLMPWFSVKAVLKTFSFTWSLMIEQAQQIPLRSHSIVF